MSNSAFGKCPLSHLVNVVILPRLRTLVMFADENAQPSMLVRDGRIKSPISSGQLNAYPPMEVKFWLIVLQFVIDVNFEHPLKAEPPTCVMAFGMVMLSNAVQLLNVYAPIFVEVLSV